MKKLASALALLALACAAPPAAAPVLPSVTASAEPPPAPTVAKAPAAPPPVCEADGERLFSPDGALFAVRRDSAISIYDTKSWTLERVFPVAHEGKLQFAGPLFVFSDETDAKAELYRIQVYDRAFTKLFEAPRSRPQLDQGLIVPSADEKTFLVVVDDDTPPSEGGTPRFRVELWSVSPSQKRLTFAVPEGDFVNHLAFDAHGNVLVGAGTSLKLLSPGGKTLAAWDYRSDAPPLFSHAGSAFVFRYDQWVELWSSSDRRLRTLRDKDCDGQGMLWSPDDKTVVLGGFSYNLCLFDAKTGRLKGTLPSPRVSAKTFEDEGMTEPLAFSADGKLLLAKGLFDLFAFDVRRGQKIDPRKALGPDVLPWNMNDTRFVQRIRDDALLVIDRGHVQARLEAGRLVAQDLSADALRVIAVSSDGALYLRFAKRLEVVETRTGGKVVELEGSEGDQDVLENSLVFSPGNAFVASVSFGPLRIWSALTGKRVGPQPDARCTTK